MAVHTGKGSELGKGYSAHLLWPSEDWSGLLAEALAEQGFSVRESSEVPGDLPPGLIVAGLGDSANERLAYLEELSARTGHWRTVLLCDPEMADSLRLASELGFHSFIFSPLTEASARKLARRFARDFFGGGPEAAADDSLLGEVGEGEGLVRVLLGKALRSEEFRPVSTVLFSLDRSEGLLQANGADKFRRLLEELYRLAGNNIRHTDRLSAWNESGDELVLICDGSDLRRARRVAERLRRKVEGHDFPFITGNVTCSFGIAELHKGESAETVVTGMKSALELAVRQGGNRVAGFSNYF